MKKAFYLLASAAAIVLAAACNKVASTEADTFDATFTVNLEQPMTKAVFSDGTSATQLQVLVYTGKEYLPNVSQTALTINMKTTVTLKLVKGKTYDIVFWAQNAAGPYTIDRENATMTVATAGAANDETRDAFYRLYNTGKVTGPIEETIELRRPFAQINVFTTEADYAAAQDSKVNFTESGMKLTAPTVLNMLTGEATTPKEYVFTHAAINVDEQTKIAGYKYIAMNYVLATTGGENTKVNFSVWTDSPAVLLNEDLNVDNVPFKRNYRTNIMGNIFAVDGKFNVIIVPEYEKPDFEVTYTTPDATVTP